MLASVQEPHPNPGNPPEVMEKMIRKSGSEPCTALKAEIYAAPGGFDMDLPVWVAATLVALTKSGNSVDTSVQCGACSIGTTLDKNKIRRQGLAPPHHHFHPLDIVSSSQQYEQSCE